MSTAQSRVPPRDVQFIVDIVLGGTGSVGRLGPFRSEREALKLRDRINRAIVRAGLNVGEYFGELYEVTPPSEWRSIVDLTPVGSDDT